MPMVGLREALSRHKLTLAFVASCLLAFLGPTYVIYALEKLELPWPIPTLLGFSLFTIGLMAIAYLYSKGAIKSS